MTESAAPLSRGRRIAIWVLIVLATVLAIVSILTTWVNRQMLDNTSWKNATKQVVRDPEIRSALSIYLANQLYQNVDVAAALRERLPKNAKPLATPIAGALRGPTADTVKFMLARPRIQSVFINSSAIAHEKLVNVLENKTGHGISTGNGVVTLDLGQLVTELGTEIGVPQAALAKIPTNTGQITLMRSDQLGAAQTGVQILRVLSVWLLILVLGMYALAVYLARGRRRTTLRTVAWAFVFVGVLVLALRKVLENYIIHSLVDPTYQTTGHHLWLIYTSILGQIGWATIFYGIVALIGVTLAGPTHAARATRRAIAPVLNHRPWVAAGVMAFIFLLLILWGGTHALRTLWGVLLIGALLAAGLYALRQQTLAEEKADPGPAWALPKLFTQHEHKHEHEAAAAPATPGRSAAEEIAQLKALRDAGSITEEEFEQGKKLALT